MPKKYSSLGCCGLDCGLCPRYYTEGSSKCPGCCGEDFKSKHPSCSFVTCCFGKKDLEVCAECADFPCAKFKNETGEYDSFVTHRLVMHNQNFIKEHGVTVFIEQQNRRMSMLKTMLDYYNDGNRKGLFCLAATLLSLEGLHCALQKAEREVKAQSIGKDDMKGRAKILKDILARSADEENVELKLRKPRRVAPTDLLKM